MSVRETGLGRAYSLSSAHGTAEPVFPVEAALRALNCLTGNLRLLQASLQGCTLARYQEQPMTGTFIPIYVCEESLPVQELCATYAPALQELVEDLEWGTEVYPS
jgi:hypothetical protein